MKLKPKQKLQLKYLTICISVILLITASYFVSDFLLINSNKQQIEKAVNQKTKINENKPYKNKYGKEWRITNPGKNLINIGGNVKSGPKIVKAEINPLKVAIGDTQTMTLEVNSNKEMDKVIAEITTDHKTIKVELKKISQRELTYGDINNVPFAIKDNGELVLASDRSPNNKFVYDNLINKLFERAKAASTMHYTFKGSWLVHDTGETTYTTKFTAYDKDNKSNSTTLAWSDPCSMPASNKVTTWPTSVGTQSGYFTDQARSTYIFDSNGNSSTCSDNTVIGIEDVNFRIKAGYSLNLNSDKLVFTPGKNIIVEDGARIMLPDDATTKIAKGYMWVNDNDSDGYFGSSYYNGVINYIAPTIQYTSANVAPGGNYVRKTAVDDTHDYLKYSGPILDCNDSDSYGYEYQTGYTDQDHDGYAPSSASSMPVCSSSYYFPSGYTRSATPYDIYDTGSYSFWYSPNASFYDGSNGYNTSWGWDFNGNGTVEKAYNSVTGSTGCKVENSYCSLNGYAGWEASVPACGSTGVFYDSSSCSFINGCAARFGHNKKQSCR